MADRVTRLFDMADRLHRVKAYAAFVRADGQASLKVSPINNSAAQAKVEIANDIDWCVTIIARTLIGVIDE